MSGLIRPYFGLYPTLDTQSFIAENAVVIGDVHIGPYTGIWYSCVIRGDVNHIRIGSHTNIQDGSVVHVTRKTHPTYIGNYVTVGHGCVLHGCTIQDHAFVGMGATVLDGAVIESGAMVAAGALVTPNKVVKSGQLWSGSPAKYMRDLTAEEDEFVRIISPNNYVKHVKEYITEQAAFQ